MSNLAKLAVYDDRIIQAEPQYAVYKGGESITAQPFKAISANSAQVNFNVVVPSPNIFVDRGVDWYGDVAMSLMVAIPNGSQPTAGNAVTTPILQFGKDCALCAFPLHQMTSTMTATINDVVVSMNTAELLPQLLRLTDYKANLKQRTCPAFLDTFQSYNSAYGTFSNPLSSYYEAIMGNYVPNGAYGRIDFCDPNNGNILAGNGNYTFNGVQVWYNGGVPTCANSNPGGALNPTLAAGVPIGIRFQSCEKLVLPPFLFADSKEQTTGLFGINAFQVVANMGGAATLQRVIRSTSSNGRTISNVAFVSGANISGFVNTQLNVEFLTPSLSIPLPPVSSIPWMEFPRYTTSFSIAANTTAVIPSNNYVLSCVPDYFMIFAKPQIANYGVNDADWLFPTTKISINFNNFSGLMNTYSIEQLYHMSVQNGLECDFEIFSALATIAPNQALTNSANLCGAPLIIRPGKDFALSQGLACGVNGNFNLQFDLTITNNTANAYNGTALIYLVAVNSGYFESHGGSSRIVKAPLTEADVINASASTQMGASRMARLVGGGFFDKIGSIINKAQHLHGLIKPHISAVKGMLPDGKVKDVLSKVGYGRNQGKKSRMDERLLTKE